VILDCSFRAVGVGIAAGVAPGVVVEDHLLTYIWLAVLFSVVNVLIGRPLRELAIPVLVAGVAGAALVVNVGLLGVVDWLSPALSVTTVVGVLVASAIIAVTDVAGELVARLIDA
jgi:putative membrane protein